MTYKIDDIVGIPGVPTLFKVIKVPTKEFDCYTIVRLDYGPTYACKAHEMIPGKRLLATRIAEAEAVIKYCKAKQKELFPRKAKVTPT